ncbi:MAG: ribulose-phosphate 3-epimerase [Acetobacteraceae bacterium]
MPAEPPARTIIAASLLAGDFARLKEEVEAIEAAQADWLHLDVMDGHFVPNISFGAGVVRALRGHCGLPFDVHLMIEPVDPYLSAFADAGADHISVHAEAGPHLHRSLQAIHDLGCKAGVAINPATPAGAVAPVLDLVDIVLVMTVDPGYGGQSFLASSIAKIAAVREMIAVSGRAIALAVDGGITCKVAARVCAAGATVLVAGTAVFDAPDYAAAVAALSRAAAEAGA